MTWPQYFLECVFIAVMTVSGSYLVVRIWIWCGLRRIEVRSD